MRAERAWFLFGGERSPNRERDSSLVNRTGDESLALPLLKSERSTSRTLFSNLFFFNFILMEFLKTFIEPGPDLFMERKAGR